MASRSWVWGLLVAAFVARVATAQEFEFERPPIDYLAGPVDDAVARLQAKLDAGEAKLERDPKLGLLPSVLELLKVDPDSQTLVFSKTSFQATRIGPKMPRALYFNDDVYVGYVKGSELLEFSAADPTQGAVFYVLDQSTESPRFERQTHECLQCHASARTEGVPGHLVRSVFPDRQGRPVFNAGTFLTGHESPFSERWGGWYVTGTHGDQRHMGNVLVTDASKPEAMDREAGANVSDLKPRFNLSAYLKPSSDLVALMVLEHQTQMHNRITAAGFQARLAMDYQAGINKSLELPANEVWPSTRSRIESPAEELVRYLLFSGEPPLTQPVAGSTEYAAHFAAAGPRDSAGRSLRDLDLQTRLFRYPCSFLIYSEAFDRLPEPTKSRVYDRLCEILSGKDRSEEFAHLSADDRAAIAGILRETKPEFAAAWARHQGG